LDFICANSIAVRKVKGSVIHSLLIFFVTQFVVSSWHLKVTMPVVPHNAAVHCRMCVRKGVGWTKEIR